MLHVVVIHVVVIRVVVIFYVVVIHVVVIFLCTGDMVRTCVPVIFLDTGDVFYGPEMCFVNCPVRRSQRFSGCIWAPLQK